MANNPTLPGGNDLGTGVGIVVGSAAITSITDLISGFFIDAPLESVPGDIASTSVGVIGWKLSDSYLSTHQNPQKPKSISVLDFGTKSFAADYFLSGALNLAALGIDTASIALDSLVGTDTSPVRGFASQVPEYTIIPAIVFAAGSAFFNKNPKEMIGYVTEGAEKAFELRNTETYKKIKPALKAAAITAVTYLGVDYLTGLSANGFASLFKEYNKSFLEDMGNLLSQNKEMIGGAAASIAAYLSSNGIANKFLRNTTKTAAVLAGGYLALKTGIPEKAMFFTDDKLYRDLGGYILGTLAAFGGLKGINYFSGLSPQTDASPVPTDATTPSA